MKQGIEGEGKGGGGWESEGEGRGMGGGGGGVVREQAEGWGDRVGRSNFHQAVSDMS